MNRSIFLRIIVVALGTLLPTFAHAHVGIGDASGFMHGFTHPASGLDHICAMLAVGLWASQTGGRSVWMVPFTFVGVMALGGTLPVLGISLLFVETGTVLSVLLLGVFIAASVRLPLWLSSSMVGLFALWHGHAHGAEMPAVVSGIEYALGFMLATTLLHVAGIAFGLGMRQLVRERVIHAAGASIALCGVYLSVV